MRGADRYHTINTTTATQEELVVLAFEAAVKNQHKAMQCKARGEHVATLQHLRIVREIFGEMLAALDHEASPELCRNLSRLYVWLIGEVARVPSDTNARRLRSTIRVTENLLDGWQNAFRKAA